MPVTRRNVLVRLQADGNYLIYLQPFTGVTRRTSKFQANFMMANATIFLLYSQPNKQLISVLPRTLASLTDRQELDSTRYSFSSIVNLGSAQPLRRGMPEALLKVFHQSITYSLLRDENGRYTVLKQSRSEVASGLMAIKSQNLVSVAIDHFGRFVLLSRFPAADRVKSVLK